MDLRTLPNHLSSFDRCEERRRMIETECGVDLSALSIDQTKIGHAEERNCEQMFGAVPIPVGYAGPLHVTFSSGERMQIHIPLATTEGALVASVNRGCKALNASGGVSLRSTYHGMTRSIALKPKSDINALRRMVEERAHEWSIIAEETSGHLEVMGHEVDIGYPYVFLTIAYDTDEAMGMNMATIASDAVGKWIAENLHCEFVTVAANVDSDKKPSRRTHDRGRGYEVSADAVIPASILSSVLKTTPEKMLQSADAKLRAGSDLAESIGHNLHSANVIAAIYLATGQDPAHVVEGSLADTHITPAEKDSIRLSCRMPAILVGVRGGGTMLPAQEQCLNVLLLRIGREKHATSIHPCRQLAETIGAAVLAGELSLLSAQAQHQLADAHRELGRRVTE